MRSDLDDARARETTALLLGQQAAYTKLLESLEQEPAAAVALDTERLRLLAASAGRILRHCGTRAPRSRASRGASTGPTAQARGQKPPATAGRGGSARLGGEDPPR